MSIRLCSIPFLSTLPCKNYRFLKKEKSSKELTNRRFNRVIFTFVIFCVFLTGGAKGANYQAIDLRPAGFVRSFAFGTSGTQQVGWGVGSATGGNDHALLWNGTAESCIDLHQFLPAVFISSYAKSIDSSGNIVGYAEDGSYNYHAILWQVPEPATILLLGIGAIMVRLRSPQVIRKCKV